MTPLATPSKIVCVGRNYTAHAAELGNEVPTEPLLFFKPPSALIQSGAAIFLPEGVGRVDYEGEIGVVIRGRVQDVSETDAHAHVGGIVPVNDVSARVLQRQDDQWARAKGFDTFCPVGTPVAADGLDLSDLTVVTRVDGEERQRGHVSQLAFSIPFLISYISRVMTLNPGDLLLTGTPEGVAPLAPGQVVEVEIPGVGAVSNPVRDRGW